MGSCLNEQQKRWNDNVQSAHRVADSYMKYAEENGSNAHELGVTAQLLNNFAEKHGSYDKCVRAFGRVSDAAAADVFTTGATHVSNFGPWLMDVFPLITAWYPEFPLKDLISVQEMEKPLAWMFFSVLKTGTNKAPTQIGEVVETPLGMRQLKAKYVTGEIFGEDIVGGVDETDPTVVSEKSQIIYLDADGAETKTVADITKANALLAYAPVNLADDYKEKLLLTINIGGTETSYKFANENNGIISFFVDGTTTLVPELELDLTTGLISFETTDVIDSIVANYVWNLDYATTDNIPRVKEDVEKIEMVAKERALMIEWTLFAEYLKKTQFGQDIQKDNLKRCLDLMYQYQVRYILDDMRTYAKCQVYHRGEDPATIVAADYVGQVVIPADSTYSVDVKVQKVLETLNNFANIIELESGRMSGNRLVVGRDFKAFLESLPNTYFKAEGGNTSAFSSPRKLGEIGSFMIYFDPYMDNDEGFMTYRGSEFYDAAYYMGMYMPLTTTDTVVLGVSAKQSFVSMEAYKFHKKNCVMKLQFSHA
jgi:hypothetical protein